MRKYISPITAGLTPDNWQENINLANMSLDETLDLWGDFKAMEAFGKKLGGFLKQAVRAKMPDDEPEPIYENPRWQVAVNLRSRKGGLDKDLITEEMGVEWVEDHSKPSTEYEEIKLKAVPQE